MLSNKLNFPIRAPKSAISNLRTTGYLYISHLLIYIKGIKDTENKLCVHDGRRRKKLNKDWKIFS